jgi:hypothetical protein
MIWATWRQHRAEALAGLAALGATAAFVLVTNANGGFVFEPNDLGPWLQLTLVALPGLVGVLIGAPLLSRDIEQGTHRLAWTQGVPRSRWVAIKLVMVFAAVLAAATALGGLVTVLAHIQSPIVVRSGPTTTTFTVTPWQWFDQQAPAFVAYSAFALALGAAVGAVVGRAYPAMALTLVLFIAVRVPVFALLRPRYLPPLQIPMTAFGTVDLPAGTDDSWTVGISYTDAAGRALSTNDVIQLINSHGGNSSLAANGLTGFVLFQPADRFWTFQGIETAIFAALAALLIALAYYWTTRRVT